jgi:hypothetical protein
VAALDCAVIGAREVDRVEMLMELVAMPVEVEVDRDTRPVDVELIPLKADERPVDVEVDSEAIPVELEAMPL